ncbi:Rho termination factor N-terminal domain-containing protein, partial [Amycolatopsis sp. SID8362]|uniref:Rho termination factor N-terminal domain-containing protein n=1 Tax=Amycolatopsis sp. SID8362 TaxID=2690346 RepID=UPI0014292F76
MSNTDLLSDVSGTAETNGTAPAPKRTVGGLTGKTVAELRSLAGELGVGETTGMRKGDLIAAIRERQGKSRKPRAAAETLPLEGVGDAPKAAPKAEAPAAPAET